MKKSELETNFGVEGKMKQEKESPGARMDGVKILNESKQKYKRNYLNEGSRHKKSESSNGRGTSNQQERTYYRSKGKEEDRPDENEWKNSRDEDQKINEEDSWRENRIKEQTKRKAKEEDGLNWEEEVRRKEEVQGSRTPRKINETESPQAQEREKYKLKGGTNMKTKSAMQCDTGRRNGLKNLRNTCYMNSLLQCLARCNRIQAELRTQNEETSENRVAHLLKRVLKEVKRSERDLPYIPQELYEEIMKWDLCKEWIKGEQEDAGELLNILINKLLEEKIVAGNLFLGDQTSLTSCKTCEWLTINEDTYTILALDITEEDNQSKQQKPEDGVKRILKIEDLLDKYKRKELLTNTDKVNCQNCGSKQNTEKNLDVVESPPILAMQLKRYKKNN